MLNCGQETGLAIFMAERVGFEPTVPFPVHMLSRHAPSAGLGYLS